MDLGVIMHKSANLQVNVHNHVAADKKVNLTVGTIRRKRMNRVKDIQLRLYKCIITVGMLQHR